MIMKKYLFFFFILLFRLAIAQDSSQVFSYEEFLGMVKEFHPIAYAAELQNQEGKAKLLKAKGGFDPKLAGEIRQKYYSGKQYYSHINAGLKIPTWFGITAQGGYQNNDGIFLNPERTLPTDGVLYAGVTVNLVQGLFMDQRRAELKQAKIYQQSTEIERKLMLNQLFYDASIAYWNWEKSFRKVQVYQKAKESAEFRFESVKSSAIMGDKPFVDTLKVLIQLQNREVELSKAMMDFNNKKALLETYLWLDGFVPLEMDAGLIPQEITRTETPISFLFSNEQLDSIAMNHPKMLYYQYNIDQNKIDYRLKKEGLKPKVEVKYNLLSSPNNQSAFGDFSLPNYNWSGGISYPIFTRKERGDLRLSKISIQEKEMELKNLRAHLIYKLKMNINSYFATEEQFFQFDQAIQNYRLLFEAENTLFRNGESSLFLVNFREQEWIKAQVKLIDLRYTYQIAVEDMKYQLVRYN